MLRMFQCNKCTIFCNKITTYKCCVLARTGQVPEVFLIAFGEIARAGETEFQSYLLDGHVGRAEQFVCADQSPLADIVQRPFPGYRLHPPEELRTA